MSNDGRDQVTDRMTPTAALVALAGTLLLATGYLAGAPIALAVIGGVLLFGGCVTIGVASARGARRQDQSVPRTIFVGVKTAIGWILQLLP